MIIQREPLYPGDLVMHAETGFFYKNTALEALKKVKNESGEGFDA